MMIEGKVYFLKAPTSVVSYGVYKFKSSKEGWGIFYFPELGDQEDEDSWGDWPLSQFII